MWQKKCTLIAASSSCANNFFSECVRTLWPVRLWQVTEQNMEEKSGGEDTELLACAWSQLIRYDGKKRRVHTFLRTCFRVDRRFCSHGGVIVGRMGTCQLCVHAFVSSGILPLLVTGCMPWSRCLSHAGLDCTGPGNEPAAAIFCRQCAARSARSRW